jgi:hypothetical protein
LILKHDLRESYFRSEFSRLFQLKKDVMVKEILQMPVLLVGFLGVSEG